jgi:phenylalanyl-tRNA synthetase alpha chain
MQAMIDELAKQAAESLGQVSGKETLASFWQEYLSKNGKIPALMKNLRTVAPEERPAMGKIINELKAKVQADYDAAGYILPADRLASVPALFCCTVPHTVLPSNA